MSDHTFAARGIGYDAGVIYDGDFDSRPVWDAGDVRADLRAIRHRLGCDTVLVMATDIDRLLDTARIAREEGLAVWIQPRLFDATRSQVSAHLAQLADRAEALRLLHGEVSLNLGCELSLSAEGFTPGRTFSSRGALLPIFSMFLPLVNLRLRAFLKELVGVARQRFAGPVSYGAGSWERPDWTIFDVVGLDAYRDAANASWFATSLRRTVERHHRAGRPVYVFEFGTCAYIGAAENASQASDVIEEADDGGMQVPTTLVRDEQVQADYLDELFDVFAKASVDGTFVWGFSEPRLTRSDEPGKDLDIASYGIVAPMPEGTWQPKRGFYTVARRHGGSCSLQVVQGPKNP
ncbi:hypothetical protein [Pelagibacterium montanilacus]|uniref:hypothetical protein n=1 Tax=Pelagibacterium montanilacus TaxID=2185280 RepID=UPI000F8CA9BC|nr:hypothetical protein [Pelagibacterium montanilacus]